MTHSEKDPALVRRREDIGCSATDLIPRDTVPSALDGGESSFPCPTAAIALAPGNTIGQYELIRMLGHGGMGEVHLARDLRLGRLVALKLMNSQHPGRNQRLLEEARVTARCSHENIVVIYEVGEHQGYPYMALEYLEGQTLRQWLRERAHAAAVTGQRAPVPAGLAVELMLPVVRALAYAHERGIVHRDLKPENIMITSAGTIKVLDFGVAKLLPRPAPGELAQVHGRTGTVEIHSSALVGTLPYMSPEQMNMDVIDHRTDLWAVGIILFEMVAGVHPVPSQAMGDLLRIGDGKTPMPSVREHRSDLGLLADIIDRCLLQDKEHRTATARQLLQELEALLPAQRMRTVERRNPFAGLAAFQEADADRFFGRDRDITMLVGKLRSLPLVAVTGPSGAGKSSLVRAGVIPALKRSGEGWEAMATRPGRHPLAALADLLLALPGCSSEQRLGRDTASSADQAPGERDAIITRLRTEPGYLGIALRAWARTKQCRLIVFIDQFEELYTLGCDAEERACVLTCLAAVADDVDSPLRIILSVRSDYLDRMVESRTFLDRVSHGLTFLPPLDRSGLCEALTRPVELCGHRFESQEMVEGIIEEIEATPCPLPLLQFTADELWARRDRQQRMLTQSSLDALGGVSGVLASHADAVLASMPAHDTRLARAVFLRLVTPERTRALATFSELRQLGGTPADMDRVLMRLIDARLLAVERSAGGVLTVAGGAAADGMVEIIHESLIDAWPLLACWLAESEEDAVLLTRLRGAARDWERSGYDPGLLWSGQAAREARTWQQRYQGELGPAEQRYLAAVLAAAERARRVRRRFVGGLLASATMVTLAMAWLAWQQAEAHQAATKLARQEGEARQEAAKEAAKALQDAARARDASRMAVLRTLTADPTTQLALLREIENTSEPPPGAIMEAKSLIHDPGLSSAVLTGHDEAVYSASFSPDGTRIVSASGDKTVRVWRIDGRGQPLVLRGHDEAVCSASFSPDGTRIVSASRDKTVRVWRADGSGEPLILRGHDGTVLDVSFSPDGTRIVSASWDKTVRVWRADGSGEPLALRGHSGAVWSAAFSPDGTRIVSASQDGMVQVWRADGWGEPLVLPVHDGFVMSASFSPDGKRIAFASDNTVQVWNADGSGEPLVLRGHVDEPLSVAFSPDATRIVSASWDNTVRVWRTDGSGEPLVLRGHGDAVRAAAFSPDGTRIVSASFDKTVRVWRIDSPGEPLVLRGHDDNVRSAAFSPDGTRIMSVSNDRTVRIWRTDGSGEPLVLPGANSASFSPDGAHIVFAPGDKTVRVWRADGSGEPLVLRGHSDAVWSAAFSPDGTRIVSASQDKTVRVWRADGSGKPLILRGHEGAVDSVSFSPDGTRIVSASQDKTVRVWRTDGSGDPLVLRHAGQVSSVSFSPDGTRIVSASYDGTVRVWRIDSPGEPLVLRGHGDGVNSALFSPDGIRIVSASGDKTVRVWRADGSGEPLVLRGHDNEVSWAEFSPDGQHIVSASRDKTVRIWRADGTGEPVILVGHGLWVNESHFSPDGRRIVSASDDHTVRVWHDLAPVPLDDPRLWTATTYCMPINRRIELLVVSEEQAKRDRQRCLDRVEQAHRRESARP